MKAHHPATHTGPISPALIPCTLTTQARLHHHPLSDPGMAAGHHHTMLGAHRPHRTGRQRQGGLHPIMQGLRMVTSHTMRHPIPSHGMTSLARAGEGGVGAASAKSHQARWWMPLDSGTA